MGIPESNTIFMADVERLERLVRLGGRKFANSLMPFPVAGVAPVGQRAFVKPSVWRL
jgi:hypothetical protein